MKSRVMTETAPLPRASRARARAESAKVQARGRTPAKLPFRSKTRDDFSPAPVPPTRALRTLKTAAAACRACPLWRSGTQTVFGEGPRSARIVFVGEQPGDAEDRAGKPFVGPAGKMLDRALQAARVDRTQVYVTNAVKHFKWTARGPRRMHETPTEREVAACRPWLDAELEALKPEKIVCLGSTAALSVFGKRIKILANRGQVLRIGARQALVTVHPSMLLRLPSSVDREQEFRKFVDDLKQLNADKLWDQPARANGPSGE